MYYDQQRLNEGQTSRRCWKLLRPFVESWPPNWNEKTRNGASRQCTPTFIFIRHEALRALERDKSFARKVGDFLSSQYDLNAASLRRRGYEKSRTVSRLACQVRSFLLKMPLRDFVDIGPLRVCCSMTPRVLDVYRFCTMQKISIRQRRNESRQVRT